ncbi:MAG: DUF47 family protein [Actinomycetota bacterium]
MDTRLGGLYRACGTKQGEDVAFQVIPRDQVFYDLFERSADTVAAGARELQALIDDFPNAEAHSRRIQDLEHEGDDLTHQIIARLNSTFVVPFDREDIHELASRLDDILDVQEFVADLIVLHGITEPLPEFRLQVETMVKATEVICRLMRSLRSLLGKERLWTEVIRLERDGDRIYRRAVARLFSGDPSAMEVLRWKDILDEMEEGMDRCEDIANAVESIALRFT